MKSNSHIISLSSPLSNLIEDALELKGKVEFTKENPKMEIRIKGKLILHFDETMIDNRIIELEIKK